MVQRTYWLRLVESIWRQKPLIWLTGTHQAGKTSLGLTLENVEYVNCREIGVRRQAESQSNFLEKFKGKRVVLDEVHRLPNAAGLLKAAVSFSPPIPCMAVAPFSLEVKPHLFEIHEDICEEVRVTPMMSQDLEDFGNPDLGHRFLKGGLPAFFLNPEPAGSAFQGWIDSLWSKGVQSHFRIEGQDSFQRFAELLLARSGELFESVRYAAPCGVSRTTIAKYLRALEAACAVLVIRPFSTGRPVEIVTAPKTYPADTGLFCHLRGWQALREEDFAPLWKQWVLNEILSRPRVPSVRYWRDKRGHEVDFVLLSQEKGIVALCCPWKAEGFDPKDLRAFRYHYPDGPNWVVARDTVRGGAQKIGKLRVEFLSLGEAVRLLSPALSAGRPPAEP